MTLSGTGEAETPAGGSVCMRCVWVSNCILSGGHLLSSNLEVSHQTTACGCRHGGGFEEGRGWNIESSGQGVQVASGGLP